MAGDQEKSFSLEIVAVLCAAIQANGGTIGNKHYELMSAIDGKRTASAFQHQFRDVLKRAREIKDMLGTTTIKPVTPAPKRSRNATQTPKSTTKKRGAAKTMEDEDEDVAGGADDGSPSSKKVKVEESDGAANVDD
ncbi:hypothetical protein MBLNU457_g0708t1 [Dothideomycetes sp. NU457]